MFCLKCGKPITEDSVYCKFCGAKSGTNDAVLNDPPQPTTSDFITLNCPRCGGNLKVQPSMGTLVCQFCGAEHLVRRSSEGVVLEAYARCPTCKRNDKVVKASISFGLLSIPTLRSLHDTGMNWGCLIFVVAALIGLTIVAYEYLGWLFYLMFFSACCLIAGLVGMKIQKNIKAIRLNPKIREENREDDILFQQNAAIWEKLYYCERDGTYFSLDDHQIWMKEEVDNLHQFKHYDEYSF